MNAIILAAGRGSRMGDLTIDLPKCRSVLHGKELIQWQMEAIASAGIKDLGIVLEESKRMNISLPGTALAQQLYQMMSAQGGSKMGV